MNSNLLVELANQCPDVNITIKAGDLVDAIATLKQGLDPLIAVFQQDIAHLLFFLLTAAISILLSHYRC